MRARRRWSRLWLKLCKRNFKDGDDSAARQIVNECRKKQPDVKDEEIAELTRNKARIMARNGKIVNRVGALIKQVPKCFEGESFHQFRERSRHYESQSRDAHKPEGTL